MGVGSGPKVPLTQRTAPEGSEDDLLLFGPFGAKEKAPAQRESEKGHE